MNFARVNELLDYNAATGVFTWKQNRRGRGLKGTRAGSPDNHGYRLIALDGSKFKEHRLAWFITHGIWPTLSIDHINGIRDDNRIENLREATQSEQNQNRKVSPKARHPGVSFIDGKYRARINIDKKSIYLGQFNTPIEAQEAYLRAKKIHHPFQPTPRYA